MMAQTTQTRWLRLAGYGLARRVLFARYGGPVCPGAGGADVAPAAGEGGFWEFTKETSSNIFNSRGLMETLAGRSSPSPPSWPST